MQSNPSSAAQILVTVIPIVGIIMGSIVIFLFLIYNHRQKMLMIEKGILKKSAFDIDIFSLFLGLFLLGIGFSLTIFFLVKEGISYSILSGIIPLSGGVSLLLFFLIRIKYYKNSNDKRSSIG